MRFVKVSFEIRIPLVGCDMSVRTADAPWACEPPGSPYAKESETP